MNEVAVKPKLLINSKLYALSLSEKILSFMQPNLPTQMLVEEELTINHPRDNEDFRIFLNYRNKKGNTVLYVINDEEGLKKHFDIDHFVNGLTATLYKDNEIKDPIEAITNTILTALNNCVTTLLNLSNNVSKKEQLLSRVVLISLLVCIFNNPLDIFISVEEFSKDNGDIGSKIVALWAVKQR